MQRSIALTPAVPDFDAAGIPRSPAYDDVYHSAAGGAEQARHVFLAGNSLPARWRGRRSFTIIEIGFGLGLNFLETWRAWEDDAARCTHLHFVSVEAHPLAADDLLHVHAGRPEHAARVRALADAWPLPLAGFHRLHFPAACGRAGSVTLTLLFGDAAALLPQLAARADALYLDGFAPAKNPDAWSAEIFRALAALSAPGTTFATWSAAARVRDGLAAVGFRVEKRRGFGSKRDMLAGEFIAAQGDTQDPHRSTPVEHHAAPARRHAVILGAGLAGTACAQRLAARGWEIDLIEREGAPARAASGNPLGLAAPLLNLADSVNARLSRAAFFYALRHFAASGVQEAMIGGVLRVARDDRDAERFARLLAELNVPAELASFADVPEGARLAGRSVSRPGLWLPGGITVSPPVVCAANLAAAGPLVRPRFDVAAHGVECVAGNWRVFDAHGAVLAEAPVLILANAIDALQFAPSGTLRLEAIRGQITLLPPDAQRRVDVAVTGEAHALPLRGDGIDNGLLIGASFQPGDNDAAVRVADHAANMARIEAQLPGLCAGLDAASLQGRTAFRTATPDRMPVFGEIGGAFDAARGLYAATGLGARGLVWAPLGAELIASQLEGEPWPLPRELAAALSPGRFSSGGGQGAH